MKGFFGRLLIIDMTDKTTRVESLEDRVLETVLGGKGLGTQLLLQYNPPGVDPFSPDNLLIFSAGILHATPVPGVNRTAVNTISPQTNLMAHSLFGGFFGPELKHAGYDKIIIKGKAPDLGAYEFDGPHWVAGADWRDPEAPAAPARSLAYPRVRRSRSGR